MISFSNKYRSSQAEILDDFELKGSEMEAMLIDLETVNKLLGGHNVTISGIEALLKDVSKEQQITIIDIGCGDGAMLRKIADFSKEKGYNFLLIGTDANTHILEKAKQRCQQYQNITFQHSNIFDEITNPEYYDIALCTLFLHHFKQDEGQQIIKKLSNTAKVGVVVNDLQRNWFAFWLFRIFSSIFIKTSIAKHDGLVSVARAFKREELEEIVSACTNVSVALKKKWAFRWQVIVKKSSDL